MSATARNQMAYTAFTVFWSLRFTDGLWILYLLHCHWSLFEVGVAESVFHSVSLISEIPAGVFADRVGRRESLWAGLAIGALTTLLTFWLAPRSVGLGTLAMGLGALGWTFVGGADQALLYAITAEIPDVSARFAALYGKVAALSLVVTAVAVAAGGQTVRYGTWETPYALTVGAKILAMIALLFISLPSAPPVPARKTGGLPATLAQSWGVVRHTPRLWQLVAFGAILSTIATTNNLLAQSTLSSKGANPALVTLVIGLAHGVGALGSLIGGRLASRRRRRTPLLISGTGVFAVFLSAIGILPLYGAIGSLLGGATADGYLEPVYQAALNEITPEYLRATVLSYPGAGFSIGMIVVFPVAGWVMVHGHLALAYQFGSAILVLLMFWLRG